MLSALAEPLFAFNAVLAAALIALFVARALVRGWAETVKAELARRQQEEGGTYGLRERELAAVEIEVERLVGESAMLRRQLGKVKDATAKIAREHFDIVHLVGEPGGDRRRFEAPLHVPGGLNGLPARVVLATHLIVVYAESLSAAKRLLEVSYASRTGYSVGPLVERAAGEKVPSAQPAREAAR